MLYNQIVVLTLFASECLYICPILHVLGQASPVIVHYTPLCFVIAV